jgi:hypothetical protein
MVAIVTDTIKKNMATLLLDQVNNPIADSHEFYIGIGKTDTYNSTDTTVNPLRTFREERNFRNNLQAVKKVEGASLVIPRYNWTAGTIFSAFSDSVQGIPTNSYYVLTSNNEVYICLKQPTNAAGEAQTSTVQPNYSTQGTTIDVPFETTDGYIWKYMYELSASRAATFLSTNWIPIEYVDSSDQATNAASQNQFNVEDAAVSGQILGVIVTSGGSGYTSTPTISFRGNGTGGSATATVVGNSITKIEMDDETSFGSGYDYAEVVITGGSGSGAAARAILGPVEGIGDNPTVDLKANNIMLNIKPDGRVAPANDSSRMNAFVVDAEFRQIGLMKNIRHSDSANPGAIFKGTSGRALRYLKVSDITNFSNSIGRLMSTDSSPATNAFIDDIDSSAIYFHQNDSSGFGTFHVGANISGASGGSSQISQGVRNSAVNPFTGEILYVENRAAVLRDADQQEDIKVIITV